MNLRVSTIGLILTLIFSGPAFGQSQPRPQTETEKKAIAFLLAQQDKDGAWMPQVGPAVTAMVVKGFVVSGKPLTDPVVAKGLSFIESLKQTNGGYYRDSNPNYNSAIVLSAYCTLPGDNYKAQITGLVAFLKSLQLDESRKDTAGNVITPTHSWYGGAGYGTGRPDLSNTSYYLEALHDAGMKSSDPVMQKAVIFLSHAQMNGETNDQPFAKSETDGGFIYSPTNGGETRMTTPAAPGAAPTPPQLRSYGSMTYSGFKSMLYAGLTEDDPRVKAALKWITSNWTLEYNPGTNGVGDGQYYFLHAFGKAMKAYNKDEITDIKGVKHNWREELNDFLKAAQKPDGSFVNAKSERWMEGNPVLATCYAVLALQEARK